MLQITDLTRSYGDKEVVSIPSFTFATGQVHGIVGLNGSGKTTFLNAVYGFGRSKNAKVICENVSLDHTNTAFLESENYFYPGITGGEYLALFRSDNTQFDLEGLNELLQVPLDELIATYSTGMRKKLALLGILKLDRNVILLDEPMNGLDLAAVRVLEAIIRKLVEQGRTVFITSHVLGPLIALCKQIHLLQDGKFLRTFGTSEMDQLETALFADLDKRTKETIGRVM
ncbi:MAG: ATP-binding cassette domain-containing protein [Flavobacteriales bacterium]|jgi:ABC-2 type transport system ATP-binding protein|nr:ATP-binding cassette domain-containing protein [Flavobacteriales bacterium]